MKESITTSTGQRYSVTDTMLYGPFEWERSHTRGLHDAVTSMSVTMWNGAIAVTAQVREDRGPGSNGVVQCHMDSESTQAMLNVLAKNHRVREMMIKALEG